MPTLNRTVDCGDKRVVVVGDVHGCFAEFVKLLKHLGVFFDLKERICVIPDDLIVVLTGDLLTRGPNPGLMMRTANVLMNTGRAYICMGDDDWIIHQHFSGSSTHLSNYQAKVIYKILKNPDLRIVCDAYLRGLVGYVVLNRKDVPITQVVVAHSGIHRHSIGKTYGSLWTESIMGVGLGVFWERDWDDPKQVMVHGNAPLQTGPVRVRNRVINVDTHCVGGNSLSAIMFDARGYNRVSVKALNNYCEA